jgi:hypothetical protein
VLSPSVGLPEQPYALELVPHRATPAVLDGRSFRQMFGMNVKGQTEPVRNQGVGVTTRHDTNGRLVEHSPLRHLSDLFFDHRLTCFFGKEGYMGGATTCEHVQTSKIARGARFELGHVSRRKGCRARNHFGEEQTLPNGFEKLSMCRNLLHRYLPCARPKPCSTTRRRSDTMS